MSALQERIVSVSHDDYGHSLLRAIGHIEPSTQSDAVCIEFDIASHRIARCHPVISCECALLVAGLSDTRWLILITGRQITCVPEGKTSRSDRQKVTGPRSVEEDGFEADPTHFPTLSKSPKPCERCSGGGKAELTKEEIAARVK